jgi:hypothetical protein
MNIRPAAKLKQSGVVLWVMVVLIVMYVITIAGVSYIFVRSITKSFPPKYGPDGQPIYPHVGDVYQGGLVIGYTPPPQGQNNYVSVPTNQPVGSYSLLIYAGDCATNVGTTNCIFQTNWSTWGGFTNAIANLSITNLMQLDPESSNAPYRFYRPVVQEW